MLSCGSLWFETSRFAEIIHSGNHSTDGISIPIQILLKMVSSRSVFFRAFELWENVVSEEGTWIISLATGLSYEPWRMRVHRSHDCDVNSMYSTLKQNMTGPFVYSTHLPLDKTAAIWADDIFKSNFLNDNDQNPIQFSLKLVSKSPIDNEPALVQMMACRRIGDKPLPEPMSIQFTDAYMREMS